MSTEKYELNGKRYGGIDAKIVFKRRVTIFVVFCGLGVSGCYESTSPFITSANAAYPFPALVSGSYIHMVDKDAQKYSFAMRRGGQYYYISDGREPGSLSEVAFYDIGDHYYIVQHDDGSLGYDYQLVRVSGGRAPSVSEYWVECPARNSPDARLVRYERNSDEDECYARDMGHMARLFRKAIAAGLTPLNQYQVSGRP